MSNQSPDPADPSDPPAPSVGAAFIISAIWTKVSRIWASASFERRFRLAQPAGQAADEGPEGVDRQTGLLEVRRLLGEVDGGQLEEAVGVVGHDHLRRGGHQLAPQLVEPGGEGFALLGAQVVDTVDLVDPAPTGPAAAAAVGRTPARWRRRATTG